jgi:hypothetical protein
VDDDHEKDESEEEPIEKDLLVFGFGWM